MKHPSSDNRSGINHCNWSAEFSPSVSNLGRNKYDINHRFVLGSFCGQRRFFLANDGIVRIAIVGKQ